MQAIALQKMQYKPGIIFSVLLHPLHDALVRVVRDSNVVGAPELVDPTHHVEAGEGGGVVEAGAVVHLLPLLLSTCGDSHLLDFIIESSAGDVVFLTHLKSRFA